MPQQFESNSPVPPLPRLALYGASHLALGRHVKDRSMGQRFSLLYVCEAEEAAKRLADHLSSNGLEPAYTVVDTAHTLSLALAEEPWDMVVAHADVPGMPWPEIMALTKAARDDTPFLLLLEEQDAAEALNAAQAGADDVLISGDWRSAAVVSRVLRESEQRRHLTRQWQRLHQDESTYRGMIDNSVLGIFQCTPWGALIHFNPSFARIMGYSSRKDLLENNKKDDLKIPLLDAKALDALLFMIQQHDFVSDFETLAEKRNGTRAWVSISARAIRGTSGEITGIEGTVEDIAKRKAVENMIIRAKQEWEKTFDSVPDIIVILDRDLCIKRLNMTLATRLGQHPKDLVGKSCSDVFDMPGEPAGVCAKIRSMAIGGTQAAEMDIPTLDGSFLVTLSPFYIGGAGKGDPDGSVLVAHDISQRQDLEAQLRQSQKLEAIGTLAGGIAHDFNNILGVMMGYSEMSLEEAEPDSPSHRRLTEILSAGRRARDLIHQILTFSRQEELDLQPLQMQAVVKETIKLMRASLPASIEIKTELTQTGTVMANLSQVHQVIMNLCTNAAHAMRDGGGTLRIELDRVELDETDVIDHTRLAPGPHARLRVTDTGHGIPESILDKVFDPFFSTKKPDEGTGMGLALVHGIVTSHGGEVSVDSHPDTGTTFEILLPEVIVEPVSATQSQTPQFSGPGRALFVDDEPPLAAIGGEMLQSMGFSVDVETSSIAALERFKQAPERYTLVVTDQTMPGLAGSELAQQILALRPDLPIVMCTGFSEEMSVERAQEMGIKAFLYKPVLKKDLTEAITKALGENEA